MGGIIGYLGKREAVSIVVKGMSQLWRCEYNLAGVSGMAASGQIKIIKKLLTAGRFDDFILQNFTDYL